MTTPTPAGTRARTGGGVGAVIVYGVLLTVGIPWYWPADDRTLWFGVPAWVCVAVVSSLAASLFTAWRLLGYVHPDEPPATPGS